MNPANTACTPVHISTCDLCDAYKSDASCSVWALPNVWRSFGKRDYFAGPVTTVQCLDDNSLVKAAVESPGLGRVLVVDGAASLARALLGGNLGAAAAVNGWAGLLINGAVRDVAELALCEVGIFALASNPMPTDRKGQGLADVSVHIQGCHIRAGDWLYADADGVVVSRTPIHA
ncbi:ribonuclease E activity regulator RraA [Comamonadaceae bacterium M7527]|nr:ribonuclease E activity regulator RraA [Comamonadaceae bacterium M7527]